MIQKWIDSLMLKLKLLWITKQSLVLPKQELVSNIKHDILDGAKVMDLLSNGVQKEDQMFKRQNNLVQEFVGDAPIVYASDMTTIIKEDQYGYLRDLTLEEKKLEEQELLADDVDLDNNIDRTIFNISDGPERITTVNYLDKQQKFEARWEEIKKRARQDKPDSEFDEETDYIDGIIVEKH